MIPTRNLASTAPSGTVAGESETDLTLVGNETRTAGKENALEQNQDGDVNGERMDVVHHEVSRSQCDGHHGDFAAYSDDITTKSRADTG